MGLNELRYKQRITLRRCRRRHRFYSITDKLRIHNMGFKLYYANKVTIE